VVKTVQYITPEDLTNAVNQLFKYDSGVPTVRIHDWLFRRVEGNGEVGNGTMRGFYLKDRIYEMENFAHCFQSEELELLPYIKQLYDYLDLPEDIKLWVNW
jgi:hypothetical protein